jgi:hypothetical protein
MRKQAISEEIKSQVAEMIARCEWFFPGAEEVDGTVQGAMRAGLKADPL